MSLRRRLGGRALRRAELPAALNRGAQDLAPPSLTPRRAQSAGRDFRFPANRSRSPLRGATDATATFAVADQFPSGWAIANISQGGQVDSTPAR